MYIALTATKNNGTLVLVFTNEKTSLEAMADMVKLGNKCARFKTTEEIFVAYSEGKELEIDIARGDNGENFKKVVKVAA